MSHDLHGDYWKGELIDTLKAIRSELEKVNDNLEDHAAALESIESSLMAISERGK